MPTLSSPASSEPVPVETVIGDAPSTIPASGVDQVTIVSDPATDRRFLLIPLPPVGEDSPVASDFVAHGLASAASHIRAQDQVREHLEQERDALADHIGQNFEELHWLRLLATVVSASHPTEDAQTVANGSCRTWRN